MAILFGAPIFMLGDRAAGPGEAHGSESTDYTALAAKHVAKGYAAAYAPKPPSGDREAIRAAREAFREAGVRIAEVGCWTNLMVDDEELREANIRLMAEAFLQADELQARCALVTVGSVRSEGVDHHDSRNYSQEAFQRTVGTARRLIDIVRPKYAKLAFEALPFDFTDTPAGMRRLLDAIERPELGVHVDLVNWLLVSPRRYWDQHQVIGEMIEELGPWIIAAHCKDLQMQVGYEQNIVEVPPGKGHVDLRAYLKALDSLGKDITLLLEHLVDEIAYDAASAYVRAEAFAAGIELPGPGGSLPSTQARREIAC
jgi:sugar phosphate isomerase/epimerase